ncbi:hypothetical protein Tco_1164939 [Tanacetum coccineum]
MKPKKISEALEDESWVDAMQEELFQFELQKLGLSRFALWEERHYRTKWVYRNKIGLMKEDVVVRNSKVVGSGHRNRGRDRYDDGFCSVATAGSAHYGSFWLCLIQGFYSLSNGCENLQSGKSSVWVTSSSQSLMSSNGSTHFLSLALQGYSEEDGIFISQDKYVAEILKKFDFANVKTASTPIETQKPLVKDEEASDVDVHLYREFLVPKGQPKLGLGYPKVSSFGMESYSDSDLCWLANLAEIHNRDQNMLLLQADSSGSKFVDSESNFLTNSLLLTLHRIYQAPRYLSSLQSLPFKIQGGSDSCLKHNMVAYLEKSEGNAEFQSSIDFSSACSFIMLSLEVPLEQQTDPSPRPSPTTTIPDSIPETSGGYIGDQAKGYTRLEGSDHKPRSKLNLSLNYHKGMAEKDPLFDEIPEDTVDHMETENAQNEGRTREMVDEDKEIDENILRPIVSNDGSKLSTDRQNEGTEEEIATQATQTSTQTPTSKIFGDDEIIAKVLLNMSQAKAVSREKEKGVELKDVEETDLKSDEEMARKIQEEWEAEEERNRIVEEKAANEALIRNFDDIKARIEADRLLAEKLQEQEREQFTIEERAKFLHDTIAAQRKFLAQQRSEAIRNRPPTKSQLRNQMMTYLKHVGNF